jgi:hypothetical protein
MYVSVVRPEAASVSSPDGPSAVPARSPLASASVWKSIE